MNKDQGKGGASSSKYGHGLAPPKDGKAGTWVKGVASFNDEFNRKLKDPVATRHTSVNKYSNLDKTYATNELKSNKPIASYYSDNYNRALSERTYHGHSPDRKELLSHDIYKTANGGTVERKTTIYQKGDVKTKSIMAVSYRSPDYKKK